MTLSWLRGPLLLAFGFCFFCGFWYDSGKRRRDETTDETKKNNNNNVNNKGKKRKKHEKKLKENEDK